MSSHPTTDAVRPTKPAAPFSKSETAQPSEDWTLDQLAEFAHEKMRKFAILGKKTAQQYWLLGRSLMMIRERLKRDDAKKKQGNWISWIESKGFDYHQVRNAIEIAEAIKNLDDLEGLSLADVRKAIRPKKEKVQTGPVAPPLPRDRGVASSSGDRARLINLTDPGEDCPLSSALVAALDDAKILDPSDVAAVNSALDGLKHLEPLFGRLGVTRPLALKTFRKLFASAKKAKGGVA